MIARIVRFVVDLWGRKSGAGEKLPKKTAPERRRKKILVGWEIVAKIKDEAAPLYIGNGRIIYRKKEDAYVALKTLPHPRLAKVLPVYVISSGTDEETSASWWQSCEERPKGGPEKPPGV